jgi:uncharacterized protein
MYRHIAQYYSLYPAPVNIEFVWHGGEPLLLGPNFYWTTFNDQTNIFDTPSVSVRNFVQTNLYSLNKELLVLLKYGFDEIGVSLDLYGGLRRTLSGRDSQSKVLANMDRLKEADIPFGCITVLSKRNIDRASQIFRFFERAGISFRVLPIFRGADDQQNEPYALSPEEVLACFRDLFELWIQSPQPIVLEPLFTYTEHVLGSYVGNNTGRYDKADWEYIYVVNIDGLLYSYADLYDPGFAHGNIFETPLRDLVHGCGHRKAINAAEDRMRAACSSCRYFGRACSGYPMAEESPMYGEASSPERASASEAMRCVKDRGILEYIEQRLADIGILDPALGSVKLPPKYEPRFMRVLSTDA